MADGPMYTSRSSAMLERGLIEYDERYLPPGSQPCSNVAWLSTTSANYDSWRAGIQISRAPSRSALLLIAGYRWFRCASPPANGSRASGSEKSQIEKVLPAGGDVSEPTLIPDRVIT